MRDHGEAPHGGITPEALREVVRLRYRDDLLQREIAERVGCSQMQVSRILIGALATLRAAIGHP